MGPTCLSATGGAPARSWPGGCCGRRHGAGVSARSHEGEGGAAKICCAGGDSKHQKLHGDPANSQSHHCHPPLTLTHLLLALCWWSRRRRQQGAGVLLLVFCMTPAACKQAGLAAGISRPVPSAAPRSHNILADVVGQRTKPGRRLLSPPAC